MGYLNARDAFPPELLKEIQRYAQGTCVYIPRCGKKTKKQNLLKDRNEEIRRRRSRGESVRALAEAYYLSTQAIYKILSEEGK